MNRTKRILLATGVALFVAVPMSGALAEAAPATTPTTTATTTATSTTITVGGGESLAGIAARYGVRVSALLRANSMAITTVIHPGDTLVIPAGASIPAAVNAVSSTSVVPAVTPATPAATYTVVAGDALAGIAWRNGVKLGALVKANGISVTSMIMPGRVLTIPPATMPIPTPRSVATPVVVANPVVAVTPVTPVASTSAVVAGSANGSLDTLLTYLSAQVGAPYQFFSSGPATFDCSGLVVAGFRQIGMSMPHQSRALARVGTPVDWKSTPIAAGDLVFTSAVNDPTLITHVGVALDAQRWVHAVGVGRTVSITPLPTSNRIMAVQRIAIP
ncbi:MAG TPA: LysM peptidoglycan-binding domain-containing protein [Ilumatobacteraceae bacterium]|nr:LysM peptidoglycan-binding domain-containing protein [Ilumatobacteraceae bacterium]